MEKSYDKNEENLEDLSEKLDLLKKKQSNIDKSLKNIQNNSFYKLIHEYNEIKVFKKIHIFNKINFIILGFMLSNYRKIG